MSETFTCTCRHAAIAACSRLRWSHSNGAAMYTMYRSTRACARAPSKRVGLMVSIPDCECAVWRCTSVFVASAVSPSVSKCTARSACKSQPGSGNVHVGSSHHGMFLACRACVHAESCGSCQVWLCEEAWVIPACTPQCMRQRTTDNYGHISTCPTQLTAQQPHSNAKKECTRYAGAFWHTPPASVACERTARQQLARPIGTGRQAKAGMGRHGQARTSDTFGAVLSASAILGRASACRTEETRVRRVKAIRCFLV